MNEVGVDEITPKMIINLDCILHQLGIRVDLDDNACDEALSITRKQQQSSTATVTESNAASQLVDDGFLSTLQWSTDSATRVDKPFEQVDNHYRSDPPPLATSSNSTSQVYFSFNEHYRNYFRIEYLQPKMRVMR